MRFADPSPRTEDHEPVWQGHAWTRDEEVAYGRALRNLRAPSLRETAPRWDTEPEPADADDATPSIVREALVTLWRAQPRDPSLATELTVGWTELSELPEPLR